MLDTVFYSVVNMSITAGIMGLLILIFRKLPTIPKAGIYYMWALVLVRLLIPFSVSSRLSLLNFSGNLVKKVVAVPGTTGGNVSLSMSNSIGAAESYFPVTYKTDTLERIFKIAAVLWITGVISLILFGVIMLLLSNLRLRAVELVRQNIYTGAAVESPMVHGFFRQRILIPETLKGDNRLNYILMHERVHIKRHDNLLRLAGLLAACVHWFNPLAWIFFKLFIDDMELTCDIRAVKGLSPGERKNYAHTLMTLGAGQNTVLSAAFGQANVKSRILNVISYKRLSVFALIMTLIFVAAASVVLLTNPAR
ncbi:methicillin resistance mecR1 protein [Ruminiclostridium hungatei]|uniref:Methicillin resistance mecR1 protein n=1 Tax=Ruminiclostridium hungatei TaxID=48256 RepID=A0A1V4SQI4_RUMHU|nr:M56 family metallopeptidase [Ruminiclostridium hungatei]OPX46043.1 methicillin resistance mecR1 protein [Ruminiclostridium hungatei]